jgi:hypothetical protein
MYSEELLASRPVLDSSTILLGGSQNTASNNKFDVYSAFSRLSPAIMYDADPCLQSPRIDVVSLTFPELRLDLSLIIATPLADME